MAAPDDNSLLGDLPGFPLTDELVSLLTLWMQLDRDQQVTALDIIRASISTNARS